MLTRISKFLNDSPSPLSKVQHVLLEAYFKLAQDSGSLTVAREAFETEIAKREGKPLPRNTVDQRLKRLNETLLDEGAVFQLHAQRNAITAVPNAELDVQARIKETKEGAIAHSSERAIKDTEAYEEPTAKTETKSITVFFSYAWLANATQHRYQLDFFNRLSRSLAYKPPGFAELPEIKLWRDERSLAETQSATPQMEEGCKHAFLGLLMLSDKYFLSSPCKREMDYFLDAEGRVQPGKHCLIVPVNVDIDHIPQTIKDNASIAQPPKKRRTLLESWDRDDETNKHTYVQSIARMIFEAAKRHLQSSTQPTPTKPKEKSKHNLERYMRDRSFDMRPEDAEEGLAASSSPVQRGRTGARRAERGGTGEGESVKIVDHLMAWAADRSGARARLTAILGEFGMGKTVACQLFTQRLLEARAEDETLPVPLYLDLRDLDRIDGSESFDLNAMIDRMMAKSGAAPPKAKDILEMARSENVVVIFDGLDEVTNKLPQDRAIRLYRELLRIVPDRLWMEDSKRRRKMRKGEEAAGGLEGPRILVSCRSHYFRDVADQHGFLFGQHRERVEGDGGIEIYTLLPFTREQIASYLNRHLTREDAERALALIDDTYNLMELAARPVLLQFIRASLDRLEAEKRRGRTINITKLYDVLTEEVFARDTPKHVIPLREKRLLLEALALHLQKQGENELSWAKLDGWLQDEIEKLPKLRRELSGAGAAALADIFAQDLRNASLLVRPGTDGFRFGHTSIREYFLASALYREVREGRGEKALDLPSLSKETLEFMLRRHEAADRVERQDFEAAFPLLLRPGVAPQVRQLAFTLWRNGFELKLAIPRPEFIDLSGLHFSQMRFGKLPLARTLWHSSVLNQAEFNGTDLSNADFSNARAAASKWLGATIDGARFASADLTGSVWRNMKGLPEALTGADVSDAEAIACDPWVPQGMPPAPEAMRRLVYQNGWFGHAIAHIRHGDGDFILSGGYDGLLRLFSIKTGTCERVFESKQEGVSSISAIDIDGRMLALSGGGDGTIKLWNIETGVCEEVFRGHRSWVHALCTLNLDGRKLMLSGDDDGVIRLWDVESGTCERMLATGQGWISSIAVVSLAGRTLALSGSGNHTTLKLFDVETGACERVLEGHRAGVRSVILLSLGGRTLALSGGYDSIIRLWNIETGTCERIFEDNQSPICSIAPLKLASRPFALSADNDGVLKLWNIETGVCERVLKSKQRRIDNIAIPNFAGGTPVLSSGGGMHKLWNIETGSCERVFEGAHGEIHCAIAMHIGERPFVLSGGNDASLKLWNVETGLCERRLEDRNGVLRSASTLDFAGRTLVLMGNDQGTLTLWDAETGSCERRFQGHERNVSCVAMLNAEGQALALSGGHDKTIKLWNIETGKCERVLKGHQGDVNSVAMLRMGGHTMAVSGSYDGTVRLWNIDTAECERILKGHKGDVSSVTTLNIAGRTKILSGGRDGALRLWSIETGECEHIFEVDHGTIESVSALSLADRTLALSGGGDGASVRLWNIETGQCERVFEDYQGWIASVGFLHHAGRTMMFSASFDGTVRLWNLEGTWQRIIVHGTESIVDVETDPNDTRRIKQLIQHSPNAWRDWRLGADGAMKSWPLEDFLRA